MKKQTAEHKAEFFKNNVKYNEGYQLAYTSTPGKSYIVKPHEGELDYDLYASSPKKFFNQNHFRYITKGFCPLTRFFPFYPQRIE